MRKRTLINRDRLLSAPQGRVANAVAAIFDRIQQLPKEIQVLALAGAFVLMTEASRLPPQDAFSAVTNLMVDPQTNTRRSLQFQAMKFHLETELKDAL